MIPDAKPTGGGARRGVTLALLAAAAALGINVFAHLGHPLLWNDEAETAVFGQRVLIYGYPKIHHRGNALYPINLPPDTARKEASDAYIGIPWAHFYVAALGELFARRAADVHDRTARLRLPFAAAGVAGLLLFAAALAPAAAAGGAGRTAFVAAYLSFAALSTSLVLHLREVRYYPLVVLELGLLILLHLRRSAYHRGHRRVQAVGIAALLVALFLTFYPACAAAAAALAADGVRRAWRARRSWRAALSAAAGEAAPVVLAAAGIAPLLVFFETLHVASTFSARLHFSSATWVDNGLALSWHLLRYDALAPAVVSCLAWRFATREAGRDALDAAARDAAIFLWTLVAAHAAVACANPVLFSRYFVAITPLLVGVGCLAAARAIGAQPARRPSAAATSAVLAAALLFVAGQWEFLSGRLAEIRVPVRGPLDFAIPFLRDAYARPEDIVIATNYEAPAFEYYLGSTVAAVPRPGDERPLPVADPDVVVPRRWWGNAGRLDAYLGGKSWLTQRFPVADVPYNNIPELTNVSRRLTVFHQFRTPEAHEPESEFLLYWRPRSDGRATR